MLKEFCAGLVLGRGQNQLPDQPVLDCDWKARHSGAGGEIRAEILSG